MHYLRFFEKISFFEITIIIITTASTKVINLFKTSDISIEMIMQDYMSIY